MLDAFRMLAHMALPKVPEEVFDLWLNQRIENNGWPPVGPTWHKVLGRMPLQDWQQLTWRKATVNLDSAPFTSNTQAILNGLIGANFHGELDEYTKMLAHSQRKIMNISRYMAAHRKLPSKLIFVVRQDGLELIDGFHRLATYFFRKPSAVLNPPVSSEAAAWIGTSESS